MSVERVWAGGGKLSQSSCGGGAGWARSRSRAAAGRECRCPAPAGVSHSRHCSCRWSSSPRPWWSGPAPPRWCGAAEPLASTVGASGPARHFHRNNSRRSPAEPSRLKQSRDYLVVPPWALEMNCKHFIINWLRLIEIVQIENQFRLKYLRFSSNNYKLPCIMHIVLTLIFDIRYLIAIQIITFIQFWLVVETDNNIYLYVRWTELGSRDIIIYHGRLNNNIYHPHYL